MITILISIDILLFVIHLIAAVVGLTTTSMLDKQRKKDYTNVDAIASLQKWNDASATTFIFSGGLWCILTLLLMVFVL